MLTILGKSSNHWCDRRLRRDFLKIGSLALGGLSLPELLRAGDQAGSRHSHKAVIMVYLAGGPSHLDTVDLKPEAPVEIRGEFQPISTKVPGMQFCEHLPRLAGVADRLAVVRSLEGCVDRHESHMCYSGYPSNAPVSGGRPSFGSYSSKLQGPVHASVPPFVSLTHKVAHPPWGNPGEPGFVGHAHKPFNPHGNELSHLKLTDFTLDRLDDRRAMLQSFDRFRRQADKADAMARLNSYQQQAFEMLTSTRVWQALDVDREDPKVRDRYGRGSLEHVYDGPPMYNEDFLVARRLVEAGVRCVSLSFGRWDTHSLPHQDNRSNCASLRMYLPPLDQAFSALIEDLYERGLDRDVLVLVWGEFGRTPKINPRGGRDHWAGANFAMLTGGGIRTGQMIGSTNPLGEYPQDRPVHMQQMLATLYHHLGIDLELTMDDLAGRPQHLLEHRELLPELI